MHQDANPFSGLPTVVKNLLLINVVLFLVMYAGLGDLFGRSMTDWLGLHYFASPLFGPWQLVTHMFMHGNLSHILLNMFALFMFGPPLEYKWGSQRFLTFYLITGIGAALLYMLPHAIEYHRILAIIPPELVSQLKADPAYVLQRARALDADQQQALFDLLRLMRGTMVGASGAVYGVLLAFGLTYPNVQLMFFPLFIPIRAKYLVLLLGAMSIFLALRNDPGDNVAHLAHLGGMVVGYVMIRVWRDRDMRRWY